MTQSIKASPKTPPYSPHPDASICLPSPQVFSSSPPLQQGTWAHCTEYLVTVGQSRHDRRLPAHQEPQPRTTLLTQSGGWPRLSVPWDGYLVCLHSACLLRTLGGTEHIPASHLNTQSGIYTRVCSKSSLPSAPGANSPPFPSFGCQSQKQQQPAAWPLLDRCMFPKSHSLLNLGVMGAPRARARVQSPRPTPTPTTTTSPLPLPRPQAPPSPSPALSPSPSTIFSVSHPSSTTTTPGHGGSSTGRRA